MICKTRAWGDALRLARQEIPDFAFDAWLAPLRVKLAEDRIVLGCPTSFHRDRVRLHYSEILLRCSPLLVGKMLFFVVTCIALAISAWTGDGAWGWMPLVRDHPFFLPLREDEF